MLRVTVELVPFGVESKKRQIAKAEIWNEGNNKDEEWLYDYGARVQSDGFKEVKPLNQVVSVEAWNRHRSVWELIREVLSHVS